LFLQFGNHDRWRVADRVGPELIDAMNAINLIARGVAVTYYGEEIGMTSNFDISFDQAVDPAGKNCGSDRFLELGCSRDPERTPMQWDTTPNAGFSATIPWLPINADYVSTNVETEKNDPISHYNFYKALARRRGREGTLKVHLPYSLFITLIYRINSHCNVAFTQVTSDKDLFLNQLTKFQRTRKNY